MLTIAPAATTVAVTPSANPSGLNQAVTFTANVAALAPGAGSPSGSVDFRDGSTRLGTVALANGSASLSTNGFSVGSHTISAIYSGDASFSSSSGSITHVVNGASSSSTTAVTSSANPSTTGSSVTLTATVSGPAGPSGSVAFYDGAALVGTAPLVGTSAALTTSALTEGSHAITARYLGNGSVPPSISPVFVQTVAPAGAKPKSGTIALTASPSPSTLDSTVTFTATVTGVNRLLPTGSVLFFVNGQVVGSGALGATGTVTARATFSTGTLAHGTHTVTAVYTGDSNYRGVATTVSLTVN
jgi:hypothetical protein